MGLTSDSRQRFDQYCDYVIDLKEQRGVKHSTIIRYKELTGRIYPAIGHIRVKDLRADHLNSLYTELAKSGGRKTGARATAKIDLAAVRKEKHLTFAAISARSKITARNVSTAIKGQPVGEDVAKAVAVALDLKYEDAFTVGRDMRPLSAKTVIEHHRLISTVLEQAVKEGIIPFNPAARVELPKVKKKEVNYFQPEEVAAIRDALEAEPIKWKTLVHLFLITGARRGEVLGLKWDKIDLDAGKLHICNTVMYSAERGIYEDTPKTATSDRFISIPAETVQLLRQYKAWQAAERLRMGAYYEYKGFVFSQDNGKPMHPDSVTDWLDKFSKRHGLPHVNPHAFRHTMASMLYFNGVDSVSISKRLGHAQVSTTANIYAHIMEEADQRNADILADVLLKKA